MKVSSWHVGVAAEAVTASLFARCGCDVSVQYGADQPEYDLVVVRSERLIKVSVKGSQDGGWGLTQSFLKNADYHRAVDTWVKRHKASTIFALVQFKGVPVSEMPRVYLATPHEIGRRLRDTAKGRGDTILYELHTWGPRAVGAGTTERIPESWRFSEARVAEMFEAA
jgi:hypothetical protein